LADLLSRVERERVFVLRYWQLVSQPKETLNRVARFIGIAEDQVATIPRTTLGRSWNQAYAPRSWGERCAQALQPVPTSRRKFGGRPQTTGQPAATRWTDPEQTLGESFEDWRSAAGRGSFAERTANGQS
jgi:hypothetical protein